MLLPVKEIFTSSDYPNLLVGLDSPDDAAVWKIRKDLALIVTTDFFTPVVDDPYDYGAISAANSISDIYAMGGNPFLALNIAALPPDLPEEISSNIFRGGAEKAKEAGVVIAGGHTIQDKEPKYGLVVIGYAHPDRIMTKAGAKPGDRLVLTKPIGFGTVTTALKRDQVQLDDLQEAVEWMTRLNRSASSLASQVGVSGATDVTGYSLLGHAWEMAQASQVGMMIRFEKIPFLHNIRRYADAFIFPGGAYDNKSFYSQFTQFSSHLGEASQLMLFDPQTSGGLLLSIPSERLPLFLNLAAAKQQPAWVIGEVREGDHIDII